MVPPDPSIFSSESNPVGIRVGTAIATLVRKATHKPASSVGFRHLWGQSKRAELVASAEARPEELYKRIEPILDLGLPFMRTAVSADWFDWASLPDLFPVSFPGVQTKRDSFLIDIDLDRLRRRVLDYFDAGIRDEELARRYPVAMKSSSGFVVRDARMVRDAMIARGGPNEGGFVRYTYRPFDERWLYWDAGVGFLDAQAQTTGLRRLTEIYLSRGVNGIARRIFRGVLLFGAWPTIWAMDFQIFFLCD